jgi:hypothetical protein
MSRPLLNVDIGAATIWGIPRRVAVVLAATLVVVVGVLLFANALALEIRLPLVVVLAGIGLALAIGRIGDLTPEAWVLEVLHFRGKRRVFELHALRREREDGVALMRTPERPEAPAAVKPAATRPVTTRPTVTRPYRAPRRGPIALVPQREVRADFFVLVLNTLGVALVVGLSLYLWRGGATYLSAFWPLG